MKPSHNVITSRQLFYLTTLELFSVLSLFLPELLSATLAQDAPVGLCLGLVLGLVFALLLGLFFRKNGELLAGDGSREPLCISALRFLFLIQCLLSTVFVLNVTGELVQTFLLPRVSGLIIRAAFFLVCVWAALGELEVRGRMAEFWGRFFALLFVGLLLASLGKVDLNQYEALFLQKGERILQGGYDVFLLLEMVIFSLFCGLRLEKRQEYGRVLRKSLWVTGACSLLTLLVLMGTFGVNYLGVMDFPVVRLLRNLTRGGGFLSRMDVLMTGIWIISLFFFVSGGLQYGGELLATLVGQPGRRPAKLTFCGLVFLAALLFGDRRSSYFLYRSYMFYWGTPVLVALLLLSLIPRFRGIGAGKRKEQGGGAA